MIYRRKRQQYFWSLMALSLLISAALGFLAFKIVKITGGQITECGCAADTFNSPWFLGLSGLIGLMLVSGLILASIKTIRIITIQRRLVKGLKLLHNSSLPPLNLRGGDEVNIFQQNAPQAFCYGFLHPQVAVSTGLLQSLSPDEIKAVISHERAHQQSHEPLKILIGEFFSRMFYFIPLMKKLFSSYKTAAELAADEAAANDASISKAIISLSDVIQMPAGALSHFSAALDARVNRILNKQYIFRLNFSGASLIISLFFVIMMGVVLVWNPKTAHAHDQQCQMQVKACHKEQTPSQWRIMDCASGECAVTNSNNYLIY